MDTEQPTRRAAFSGLWSVNRILLLIGGVCFLIAALSAADILNQVGPDLAWAFGGFSAWTLSGAI
jgi:hypothetical protein